MNYKITFGSQKDSKNAQQLLFTMGYEWVTSKKRIINTDIIYFDSEMELSIVPSADLGGESAYKNITLSELRAMASTEKEYINKTTGEYRKTSDVVSGEQWIEVPIGATAYTDGGGFYKEGGKYIHLGDNKWDCWEDGYLSAVVWQRPTQPEAPPFVYDEPSLDAEIENAHYFKDVSDIDTIDVYEVLKRFNVTDPCLQHLIKKSLCVGNRGHKDLETDLRDILKSAKRALEINGFSL